MSSLPLFVQRLWIVSIGAQVLVLYLLFLRRNARKLPFFTAYVALNLCQAPFLMAVYSRLGIDSLAAHNLAWASESITLLAAALATTEILEVTLKPYQGIWGLVWRAVTGVSIVVILLVALATRGHWHSARWFELNRGYHLTFASAVIACLILTRYYVILVPTPYKMILAGFCFYSCTEILINTIIQALLKKHFYDYQPVWQASTMLSFVMVQGLWIGALRKTLPVGDRQPAALTDSTYQRLSPEINARLRDLNEKLLRIWKLEARSN